MKKFIKLILYFLLHFILCILKLFPTKKKNVFFESYGGKQFCCNPMYLYKYMQEKSCDLTYIWALYDSCLLQDKSTLVVKPKTIKYFYYLVTAKYVFTNIQLPAYIPKKADCLWINTWHGGGKFKRVDNPTDTLYARYTKKIIARNTDYYITSSTGFTSVMQHSTGISITKFIKTGMPRNDIFFDNEKRKQASKKVREFYNIQEDDFIILYAPTYRGKVNNSKFVIQLDIEKVNGAILKRFNRRPLVLFRAHHAMLKANGVSDVAINVSSYPDIQELLCAADFMITDYSSVIWDYSLTRKPGLLFTPDLEEYESNRGLYSSIITWPFIHCKSNNDIEKAILNYDEKYSREKIENYLTDLGCYDNGSACLNIIKILGI